MAGYTFVVIMVSLRVTIPLFDPQTILHDDYKRVAGHFLAPLPTLFHSAKIPRGATKCTIFEIPTRLWCQIRVRVFFPMKKWSNLKSISRP